MIYIYICLFLIIVIGAYYLLMWPKSKILGYYPYDVKTEEKIIALTFDDGPSIPYTTDLLKVLEKYKVMASFFLVGKNVEKNPELAREIFEAGHSIGNHAYSHNIFKYLSSPSLKDEITKTQEIIFKATGKRPILFRSPWLIRTSSMFKVLRDNSLTPISGLFGTQKEVWQVSAETIYRDAIRQVSPGKILIFHDGFTKNGDRTETIKAIDFLIPQLKKQGYKFMKVEELLKLN